MRFFFALAATVLLCLAAAGCRDRSVATAVDAPGPVTTTLPSIRAPGSDERVTQHYGCQAGTGVELLDDGTARVSLPGGERHTLTRVANSDPQVYAGDSLYFTIQEDAAYLSQQDGARELACAHAGNAG